jgi:predicted amidohydrolase
MGPYLGSTTMLKEAERKAREYQWAEAAESYRQALRSKPRSNRFVAEIWEKAGFCYNRASRQAEDLGEFKSLRQRAGEAYRKAGEHFGEEDDSENQGRQARCYAIVEYVNSWLASSVAERKSMLDKCCTSGTKALEAFEKAGDDARFGETCNSLQLCLFDYLNIASSAREKRAIAQRGIDYGEKAISALTKRKDKSELIVAYSLASLQNWYAANINEQEAQSRELTQRSLDYSEKALALSEEVDDPYSAAMSRWAATFCSLFFTGEIESSLKYAEEMRQLGSTARDKYLKGVALYLLAFVTELAIAKDTTPDKKKERCNAIFKYAEEGIQCLQVVTQDFFIAETSKSYAESYTALAREVEVDVGKKCALLEEAARIGRKGLEHAVRSGSPDATASTLHTLSKALSFHSNLIPMKREKRALLEEALARRREYVEIVERTFPSNDWVLGVGKYYEAVIEAELARQETDHNEKVILFENAVSDMENGVSRCNTWIASRPTPSPIVVAIFEDKLGDTLDELFALTRSKDKVTRAINVYEAAMGKFRNADLPSRVAECCWKIARNNDLLGRHQEAAANFEDATTYYRAAAEKIHQFASFYRDYAVYMEAWNEIEKAKLAHKREEYDVAKQNYEKTATLLNKSKLWGCLASNFLAWSLLEQAEDLSRQEESADAIESFKKATNLFEESMNTIEDAQGQLGRIEQAHLIKTSDTRKTYCVGRVALEEARILDRQGDHAASSRKYGSAAKRFRDAVENMGETEKRELVPIISLCQAWQKMTQAEAESSPDLYLAASQLFEEAKEQSSHERAKTLALGHSRFCKALEAGTRFEDTRDAKLHLTATQHLESAANYYIKAGFKTASEYAIGTQRLFNGYNYMYNANEEPDPEKKARYYIVAERVLMTSAQAYMKAKHPEKAEQVYRLLEKIKEERELATSLGNILHAPAITSSTASFVTPTPTDEKAVGLERFEHANIQGHLTVPEEVALEEDFDVQLDLVNVARNFGLIVRIDNLLPKEFTVTDVTPAYAVKDGSVDLGGKRFDPLKVESIKISARGGSFGVFKVSPHVVYIDEAGQFLTCRPEAVHIKVSAPVKRPPAATPKKKYQIVYRDILEKFPRIPKSKCRAALAQIGVSESGDVVHEFYEEKTAHLFGLREEKVELVRSNVENMIEAAHAKSINILLFPELTVDLNYSQLLEEVVRLAKAYEMYIVPGSYHDQKTKRNISMVIGPDGILWQQEKHIPAIIHYEGEMLTEGIDVGHLPRKTFVCNTEFGRIAIAICRDFLDMDLRVALKNVEPPVDIVLNPAFTPVTVDFKAVHFDARRSIYAYCFFANVAEFGNSLIYTPEKERIERTIPPKEERLIYKDIDIIQLRLERERWEKLKRKGKGFIQSTR